AGGIGADEVAQHLIAAADAVDQHAILAIAGNEVQSAAAGAADRVVDSEHLDTDAVGHGGVPGVIGADMVAQHLNAGGAVIDQHPVFVIAGNHVAGRGGEAADRVVGTDNLDALPVAQPAVSGGIGADVVAQHLSAAGAAVNLHAVADI